jgi:hypothetical protein
MSTTEYLREWHQVQAAASSAAALSYSHQQQQQPQQQQQYYVGSPSLSAVAASSLASVYPSAATYTSQPSSYLDQQSSGIGSGIYSAFTTPNISGISGSGSNVTATGSLSPLSAIHQQTTAAAIAAANLRNGGVLRDPSSSRGVDSVGETASSNCGGGIVTLSAQPQKRYRSEGGRDGGGSLTLTITELVCCFSLSPHYLLKNNTKL